VENRCELCLTNSTLQQLVSPIIATTIEGNLRVPDKDNTLFTHTSMRGSSEPLFYGHDSGNVNHHGDKEGVKCHT